MMGGLTQYDTCYDMVAYSDIRRNESPHPKENESTDTRNLVRVNGRKRQKWTKGEKRDERIHIRVRGEAPNNRTPGLGGKRYTSDFRQCTVPTEQYSRLLDLSSRMYDAPLFRYCGWIP